MTSSPICEYEDAITSIISPLVCENPALNISLGTDHKPTADLAVKELVKSFNKCETFFNQHKLLLQTNNPSLDLLQQIEHLEHSIKLIDDVTNSLLLKSQQWQRILAENRQILDIFSTKSSNCSSKCIYDVINIDW